MTNISFSFENPLKDRFGENFFKKLPNDPGVYTFIDARGLPLYIGKADNLRNRLMSYQRARPGQAPDHILEMIEHAADLKFELKACGADALRRETELIRSVRPPYNVALNYDVSYMHIALRAGGPLSGDGGRASKKTKKLQPDERIRVEFRLSHIEVKDGFTTFGCFRHRGKAKGSYSALMRLLYAAYCPRERFQLPSRICRSSPPYCYITELPHEIVPLIEDYLSGRNSDLLRALLDRLLERENFPKQLYLPMQRDLELLKNFFKYGPQDTAAIARRLRLKQTLVPQEAMDRLVAREFAKSLKAPVAFPPPSAS